MKSRLLVMFGIILIAWGASARAESTAFGDWFWDFSDNDDFVFAATMNSDGRILGQYCYYNEEYCIYVVSFGTLCTEGDKYPVLLNTETFSKSVEMVCGHIYKDANVFYFTDFDEIDSAVRSSPSIGYALAMKEGRFKVVRFSLSGSGKAIDAMREAAEPLWGGGENDSSRSKAKKFKSEEFL